LTRKADRRFIHETVCHWHGELNNANAFLPPKLASLHRGVCERALITIAWTPRAKGLVSGALAAKAIPQRRSACRGTKIDETR